MTKKQSESSKDKIDDDEKEAFYMSPGRLETLTDGVFAITMTLLIIEIHAYEVWPKGVDGIIDFYSYFIGFWSLGVFWIMHHYVFHYIKRSTGGLVWLNIAFLAATSLVPFWTKVIEFRDEPFEYGLQFYGIYMIITLLILIVIFHYAAGENNLVDRNFNRKILSAFDKTIIIGVILLTIGIVGGTFVPVFGNFIAVPGIFFVVVTIYGPHKIFK